MEFVNGIFGANVLKDAFVNLRITDEAIAADGSAVVRFLADLKKLAQHFRRCVLKGM